MPKIFITRRIPDLAEKILKENGCEVVVWAKDRTIKKRELIRALRKERYDAVISLLNDKIDKDIFDASPSTRIYANYATGFDNIDIEEAKKRGIIVTNTPGVSAMAVAEHTVALIFALTTRLVEGDREMRAGKYAGWAPLHLVGTDLFGKKVGLIGVGNIGYEVARMMKLGFGTEIIYYDVRPNEKADELGGKRLETIEALLKEADIVSLHVPLLDSTRHLINAERLNLMKSTAFLINTSRGPVIDEAALVQALKNGVIRGAGLDVYEFEPRLTPGLTRLSNIVLTPHIASARESVREEMARIAVQGVLDFLQGKDPKSRVN